MGKEMGYLMDGLSRDERLIKELLPEFIKIEDRDIVDQLKIMSNLSRHLIYFNDGNKADGDWEEFFKTDYNLLNNLLVKFDLQVYLKYFTLLEIKLERAVSDEAVMSALKKVFLFILASGLKMHDLGKRLLAVQKTHVFDKRLKEIIGNLEQVVETLWAYNDQIHQAFDVVFIADEIFEVKKFKRSNNVENIFPADKGISESTGEAFIVIKALFETLRTSFNRLLNACIFYVKENPILEQSYSPHLALVITFLDLYGHLKTDINEVTVRHLDFYYQRILGFSQFPALPNKVNLLFEPLPDVKQVALEKGELVSGNLPEFEDGLFYELDRRIVLSDAHISALKTLFAVRTDWLNLRETEAEDTKIGLSELQLFKGEYENPDPAFFVKNADLMPSWPIFGDDINELTEKQRQHAMAETGLLISSPVLYQQSGLRKIEIRLFITADSYTQFIEYLNNYQGNTDQMDNVKYLLLENAFVIEFTGPAGWEKARLTRISLDEGEKSLVLELQQGKMDLPFAIYSPLHGALPGLIWPAVRLIVNNEANFNPLAYLQNLNIERISIQAEVSGLTDYMLQNNIGNLSNATVFQPFGPVSPVKSYLDIVNPNVFNKFLSKLELRMEWAGLPDVSGGFETYYQDYGANIKNSSFRARLLSHKYNPFAAASLKNDFPLFESDFDANYEPVLKQNTTFKKEALDVKELGFTNNAILGEEVQLLPGEMTEGTLRIEFSSPAFGFGHSSFPAIFSDAALHNSKRFVKKRPLPEQPYTPLLNNVFIDYTQRISEQLNNATGNIPAFNNITLFYLEPFGYEQVFPGKIRSEYPLIPAEEYDSNFYIGFDKITPGEALSILFHLEEKTAHESAVKVEPLQWSYLYHNSWIRMNEKYVLSDTTESFITSGIVQLIVPEDIKLGNTRMPGELYWMKIAVAGRNVVKSKIKALFVNVVPATHLVGMDDPDLLILPPAVLKTIVNPVKGIQNIWQLFPSFGGKPAENKVDFYIRVSQRLRHKNRLLMARDIEQTVLENFPEIIIAKCLRTDEEEIGSIPDFSGLRIILVALTENSFPVNMKPMVSLDTLCKVKDFLQPKLSPQVDISIENPVYERVKVVCKVKLVSGNHAEQLFYTKQLEKDINEFISPWYFRRDTNYGIGRKLFVEEMRNFIKSKPYILTIEHFGLGHFYHSMDGTGMNDSKSVKISGYLVGSVPEAIFIPAETHFIEISESTEASHETLDIGLNYLRVGDELLIGEAAKPEHEETKEENKQFYNWVISTNK
ncbi:hypothetical protein [Pedobacter gandavensis]|uniref:Baseplate protein J-like domain-containing protein n=1 Tax=Pedobacter gandavensis TaxID=2679963 RepID=A0ABR6ERT8_9SPHI|nr:hypothetical protein [Pedobacter gandavensis]MBB2147956.1 hypothetical protein [Pedobacter gandavensis]